MNKWQKPRTKMYRGISVDAKLNLKVLDKLNTNPKLKIRGVCSGHTKPTEQGEVYRGNIPSIVFSPKNKKGTAVCAKLRRTAKQDIKCSYSKKYNLVEVTGKRKGTAKWWKEVSESIYKL